jgi:uncharacterized membrane protein YhaH (DUF805 family)
MGGKPMSFPKTPVGWIAFSAIVISFFLVATSDNPVVFSVGFPLIIIIVLLVGLTLDVFTGDRSKGKAAVDQIKRNLSDKRLLLRALLRGILTVLWPIAFAVDVITIAWKSRSSLLSFTGRASRKMYWRTIFLYFAWAFTTMVIQVFIVDTTKEVSQFAYYTTLIVAVGPIIASAPAIGVRRLHDINKSGWWLLLFYLVPAACLGLLNLTAVSQNTRDLLVTFLFLPATIWAFIDLGCRRGTLGPNKYGTEPTPLKEAGPVAPQNATDPAQPRPARGS